MSRRPCAHCQHELVGYAAIADAELCHPDTGMDCYHLVTLYRHEMPCTNPFCAASVRARQLREANTVTGPDQLR